MASGSLPVQAIALMGPTASGKTDLAVALAQRLNGEVISVDSALVYRGLNIGAAKPTMAERQGVMHHLLDIRDPEDPYSAADFSRDAGLLVADIIARQKVPILAGGTMLYFKALLEGLSVMPEANPEVRGQIEKEAQQYGWPHVHNELEKVDPEAAARIHPNHSQRLSRALEVWRVSGKPISEWQTGFSGGLLDKYRWLQLVVAPSDRKLLHRRIELRLEKMLQGGFIEEVKSLRSRPGVHKDLPAIRAVGYRQVWEHLDGDLSYPEMFDKALVATRQLAKRQLTWLRGWQGLNWLDTQKNSGELKELDEILQDSLNFYEKRTI